MKRFFLLAAGLCLAFPILRAAPTTTGVSGTDVIAGQSSTFTGWAEGNDVAVHWLHFYVNGPGLPGWNYAGSAEVDGMSVQGSIDWPTGAAGGYAVHVRAENWNGEWDSNADQASGFNVSAANRAPHTVWASGDNVIAGQATTLKGNATDDDGNLSSMNFYVTGPGMPGWNYVDSAGLGGGDSTGEKGWTPPGPGSYAVHIRAWDDWGWVDDNGNVASGFEVAEGNHAPHTDGVQAASGIAGQQITLTGTASDQDGVGDLAFMKFYITGPGMPGWNEVATGTFSGNTATGYWTPSQKGNYTVHIRAWDEDEAVDYNADKVASVTVSGRPPTGTISLPGGNTASVGQAVLIRVTGSDPDGDLHYINIDQTSPTNGYYGPGDTGTQTPPNNGAYNLGGYFGSRTRDLTLTFSTPGSYTFRGAVNDDSGWVYTQGSVTVTVSDATAPTAPTNLEAYDIGANSFRLRWSPSTDNVGVTSYEVYINGVPKGTVQAPLTQFNFAGLTPNTNFSPAVRAFDAAGKSSDFTWLTPVVRTLDGPPPSGVQSAWLDVDGDGIRDEIIRPGSPGFGYQVTQWHTPNPAYLQTLVNLFWTFQNVTFDLSGNAPLVLNYGPNQTELDGDNTAPDFGLIWNPDWFPGADSWSTSYMDIEFHAHLEAGYRYKIVSTDHPDSISPGLMDTEKDLGEVLTTGGVFFYRQNLSPSYVKGRYFHLVRMGKPLGGVLIKSSSGTLLGSIFNGGTFSITLSPQATAILSAVDMIGKALANGPQIVWQVRDAVTGLIRNPWSVVDSLNASSLGSGVYTVSVRQDNRIGLDGISPFVYTFTFVIGNGSPIAFVKDGQGDHVVDDSDPVLNFARVGHWGEDLLPWGGLSGFDGADPALGANDNFIERDPQRFYVRVTDMSRNQNSSQRESISVTLGTVDASGNADDNQTAITLIETTDASGVFVSKAQLLVSENIPIYGDDEFPATPATPADDTTDDRTHRVHVDGRVKVIYQHGGNTHDASIPAADDLKTVKVVLNNFYEPFTDSNGNGNYDSGESFIDISAGAPQFATTGTWGPIWSNDQIELQKTGLRAILAQARIKVVFVGSTQLHKTVGALFAQQSVQLGRFDAYRVDGDPTRISRDHKILHDYFRSPHMINGSYGDDDTIDVFFVPALTDNDAAAAVTMSIRLINNNNSPPTPWTVDPVPEDYGNTVFLGLGSLGDPSVLAHEILHILTNKGDDASKPAYLVFPYNKSSAVNVNGARRMQEITAGDARTQRAQQSPQGTGNNLLR